MSERETILKTVLETYVVEEQFSTGDAWLLHDEWDSHLKAFSDVKTIRLGPVRISKRTYYHTNQGRIRHADIVIFYNGTWVDSSYDPRRSDPEFARYLELKQRFED